MLYIGGYSYSALKNLKKKYFTGNQFHQNFREIELFYGKFHEKFLWNQFHEKKYKYQSYITLFSHF